MSKTLPLLSLVPVIALSGCAGFFLTKEERAARERSLAALSRVGVLGASVSAGFGTGRTLADILDVAVRSHHQMLDAADAEFFQDAPGRGEKAVAQLKEGGATLVIGLDWLFWFAYGEKTADKRRADLAGGLRLVEGFDCPIFLGDLPDMTGASESMLPPRLIPPPGELADLNGMIRAWAAAHPAARLLPLSRWTENLREGKPITIGDREVALDEKTLLQEDRLHPTEDGQLVLASGCLEAVRGSLGGLLPGDLLLDRERLRRRIDEQPCAVSIEVVDGQGAPVREGSLHFTVNAFDTSGLSKLQFLRLARYGYLLHPQPLSGGNPFQLSDLPSYISSGTFSVSAEAPALVPSDWTSFGLVPGKATRLRIVLPKPSTLEVVVRDASSGEPVPAALAISVTELRARGLNATEALDRGGPGTGHGDAVGAMTLADIRPGVHLVEVHAPGYQTLRLEKVTVGSGASLEARLRRIERPGSVTAMVTDPDGKSVAGIKVFLERPGLTLGRVLQTGADGRVRFEEMAAGPYSLRVDLWPSIAKTDRAVHFISGQTFVVEEGKEARVELGFVPGGSSLTVRVMDGERPLGRVKIGLLADVPSGIKVVDPRRTTGSDGAARFERLRPGAYRPSLNESYANWTFPPWEVREGESLDRTIEVGSAKIRGKLLRAGASAKGRITITGPGERSAGSYAASDGIFEFHLAVPGRYRLEAQGAQPVEIEVPPEGDPPPVEIRLESEAGRE